jgi:hypothetical protein
MRLIVIYLYVFCNEICDYRQQIPTHYYFEIILTIIFGFYIKFLPVSVNTLRHLSKLLYFSEQCFMSQAGPPGAA